MEGLLVAGTSMKTSRGQEHTLGGAAAVHPVSQWHRQLDSTNPASRMRTHGHGRPLDYSLMQYNATTDSTQPVAASPLLTHGHERPRAMRSCNNGMVHVMTRPSGPTGMSVHLAMRCSMEAMMGSCPRDRNMPCRGWAAQHERGVESSSVACPRVESSGSSWRRANRWPAPAPPNMACDRGAAASTQLPASPCWCGRCR